MVKSIESEGISFSLRNGLYMPFIYKGVQVVVHNSSWSFREKIWVDDELVHNQSGYSMSSTTEIEVAGDTLSLSFGYRNTMSEIFLEVRKGDELVHELSYNNGKKRSIAEIAIGAALGIVGGYVVGYQLTRWLVSLYVG